LRLALAIALCLSTWATAFVGARYALRWYSPGPAALARFVAASAGFALVAFVLRGRRRWPPRADLPRLLLSGTVGNAIYHLSLNEGQRVVPAAVAAVLVALSPIFTALLARAFLHERVGARGWAGIAVSFAGTALIASRHGTLLDFEPAAGWVLVAAAAQAAAFILVKPPLARASPLTVTAVTVWAGTATLMVFAPDLWAAAHAAPLAATLTLLYLGLLPGVVGALCFAYVLARVPASRAAPLLYAVPPFTLVLGWLLLGETATATAIAGGIVALAGVALVAGGRRG
jgi:drug/metabolite transporter (DMT)-like permease